ncbi:hypothetical protein LguiB_006482 [Lonicera macranthoides]
MVDKNLIARSLFPCKISLEDLESISLELLKHGPCPHQDRKEVLEAVDRETKSTVKKSSLQVIERYYSEDIGLLHKQDLGRVEKETYEMLASLGLRDIPRVVKQAVEPQATATVPAFGRGGPGGFAVENK